MVNPVHPPLELEVVDAVVQVEIPNDQASGASDRGHPRLGSPGEKPWVQLQDVTKVVRSLCGISQPSPIPSTLPQTEQKPEPAHVTRRLKLVFTEAARLVESANMRRPHPPKLAWRSNVESEGLQALHSIAQLREHIILLVDLCQLSIDEAVELEKIHKIGREEPLKRLVGLYDQGKVLLTSLATLSRRSFAFASDNLSNIPCGETERDYIHDTIDYLTAMLVDILASSIDRKDWNPILVALTARLAAMLKEISQCLFTDDDLLDSMMKKLRHDVRSIGYLPREPHFDFYSIPLRRQESTSLEIDVCQDNLVSLMREVAVNLPSKQRLDCPDTLERTLQMHDCPVTQEQMVLLRGYDGDIGAGSHAGLVRLTQFATEAFIETCKSLEQPPATLPHGPHPLLSIEWVEGSESLSWARDSGRKELRSLKSMITVLIPHSMISGVFATIYDQLVSLCRYSVERSNDELVALPGRCPGLYQISVRISKPYRATDEEGPTTAQTHSSMQRRGGLGLLGIKPQKSLHHAPRDAGLMSSTVAEDMSSAKDDMSRWSHEKRRIIFKNARDEYDSWVVDDNSIILPYKKYAWGFLGIATGLVVGGLAVGLSIGKRIQGVDPFNISVFCWVLAAFMLVVVKATRVENWSWHRFLRGEVACRSITEVVSVTGMDPQVLLVILLRLDHRMFLQTRGPFNAMFRRHTDDPQSGFSINVPIKATTAFEGGLIPIMVQGKQDPGLILLQAHSWAPFNSVRNWATFENGFNCRDIQHKGSWAPDKSVPCYRLSIGDMGIVRVLGLYNRDSYLY